MSTGQAIDPSGPETSRHWMRRHLETGEVLLLEPDEAEAVRIAEELSRLGVAIRCESDALRAIAAVASGVVDVLVASSRAGPVVLADLTRLVRQDYPLPVLLAHGVGEEDLIGAAVLAGARPVVALPYVARDLAHALCEVASTTPRRPAVLTLGVLEIAPDGYDLRIEGRPVDLSPIEFGVVLKLAEHGGRAVSRASLVAALWPRSTSQHPEDLLNAAVCRIRRKLEPLGLSDALHTVRGYGYRLEIGLFSDASGPEPATRVS